MSFNQNNVTCYSQNCQLQKLLKKRAYESLQYKFTSISMPDHVVPAVAIISYDRLESKSCLFWWCSVPSLKLTIYKSKMLDALGNL